VVVATSARARSGPQVAGPNTLAPPQADTGASTGMLKQAGRRFAMRFAPTSALLFSIDPLPQNTSKAEGRSHVAGEPVLLQLIPR